MNSSHSPVLAKLLTILLGISLLSAARASVTFNDPPVLVVPNLTVIDGTNVTLTASLTIAEPTQRVLIQWLRNGVALQNGGRVSGATTNKLVIKAAQKVDQASYSYRVIRIEGGTTQQPELVSDAVNLTVKVRPVIVSHPVGGQFNQDDELNLSVGISPDSDTPLTYEWQLNNQPINATDYPSAATANFLIPARDDMDPVNFPGVQWRDAGNYRVKITNSTGITVFTKPATVKVASAAVLLSDLPGEFFIATKAKGKLSVLAGGTPKLSYQWSIDGEGNVLKGGNASSISIAGTPENDGKVFRVTVTNAATDGEHPAAVSSGATIRVINKLAAPLVTGSLGMDTYQKGFTFNKGTAPVLEVQASIDNTGDLAYRWQKDGRDISDSATVTGTNARQLVFSDLAWSDRGVYRCIVSNQVGVVTSKTFALGVNSPPVILTDPAAVNVAITGGKATLTVLASGSGKLSYQWFKKDPGGDPDDDFRLPKATSNKLTLSKLLHNTTGDDYYCEVTNAFTDSLGGGTPTLSALANLIVYDPVKIVTQPPASVQVEIGTLLSLSVGISGDTPVVYEWYLNKKTRLVNGPLGSATVSGADTASLQIANLQPALQGSYTCIVRNALIPGTTKYLANVTSKASKVVVVIPPGIQQDTQASPASPVEEEVVTLSVVGNGTGPLKYQWQKFSGGGWIDLQGKTSNKLIFSKVQLLDSALYRCKVNNVLDAPALSTPLDLQVQEIPEATITAFVPAKALAGEKVRALGPNMKYVKTAKIGASNAGVVIENPTSVLLTVPGTAPLESVPEDQRKILLQTKNYDHLSAQPFTRTLTYANNGFANATILTGSRVIAVGDNTDFSSSEGGWWTGDVQTACYWWTAPKRNTYQAVATCTFDASLIVYRGTPLAVGLMEKTKSVQNISQESVIFNAEAGQDFVIVVAGNNFAGQPEGGIFRLDIFETRESADDASGMTVASELPMADLDSQADLLATVGGQMMSDYKEFRLGGVTGGDDPVVLTELVKDVPADASVVTTSFQMTLETPGEGVSGDGFGLLLYGEDDSALAGIWINARDGQVSITDDQRDYVASEQVLLSGAPHQVELTVDRVAGTWSVTLDGASLVDAVQLPTAALFKELSPVWQASTDGSPPSTLVIRRFEVRAD